MPFLSFGAPSDLQDMRRSNRNRILRSIITRGPATRAELARRTGMSRPTVSVIANDLLTAGVLMEGERVSSGGAPGTLLEMARDTGVTLVADVRRIAEITLATVSVTGEVVSRSTGAAHDEADLLALIEGFSSGVERRSLIGAALAVDGFVDPQGVWREDFAGGVDVGVVETLRRRLRMPVFAVNAADAVAVADVRDSRDGLAAQATLVAHGTTLGLIVEGRLLTGQRRTAGDIAHVVPGIPGPVCEECRQTCLHALMQQVFTADSPAAREDAAAAMAAVIAPIAAAIELEEIVLALLPAAAAGEVCRRMRAHLQRRLPAALVPEVRLSLQGTDALLIGAAAMMVHSRLS